MKKFPPDRYIEAVAGGRPHTCAHDPPSEICGLEGGRHVEERDELAALGAISASVGQGVLGWWGDLGKRIFRVNGACMHEAFIGNDVCYQGE